MFKKAFLAGIVSGLILTSLLVTLSYFGYLQFSLPKLTESKILPPKPKPLEKYTLESLSQKEFPEGQIALGETIQEQEEYTSRIFSLTFDPTTSGQETKKTSGLINIPNTDGKFPVVVMFRGFVDQTIYQSGMGTKRAAEVFVKNKMITLSPDFLGYAQSDSEAGNIFESRFQTYTTAAAVLASIPSLEKWDGKNIFIWGHSNGGQVALTTLEITGKSYPTTLWAPVSRFFPYSILYYTDESEDRGKFIRRELAKFEEDYDTDLFSTDRYLAKINKETTLQIHQGTNDDAIPLEWTNTLVKNLKNEDLTVNYFTYPGADHNLQPTWNTVVTRDLDFFQKNLK
jgi:dipeptidyl aminopeptidase/acylaminoacyl peptidase